MHLYQYSCIQLGLFQGTSRMNKREELTTAPYFSDQDMSGEQCTEFAAHTSCS
jgi:hypothetical protein